MKFEEKRSNSKKQTSRLRSSYCLIFMNHFFDETITNTVKPVYSDHPWDSIKVAVVQRWPLFRGYPPPQPKRDFFICLKYYFQSLWVLRDMGLR